MTKGPQRNRKPRTASTVPARGFVSTSRARSWEEAIVSGNGVMGALVMGQPHDETVILSHARLYLPLHQPLPPVKTALHLKKIRAMLAQGDYQGAAELVVELTQREGWGGKRWTDPFVPACDIRVTMPPRNGVRNYKRSVDFETGVARVQWTDPRGTFIRRVFVSRPDNVVVLSLAGAGTERIDCEVQLATHPAKGKDYWQAERQFKEGVTTTTQEGFCHEATKPRRRTRLGACEECREYADCSAWLVHRMEFAHRWKGSLQGCENTARVVVRGGTAVARTGRIVVRGAVEVLVLARIEPSWDIQKSAVSALKRSLAALPADFDRLLVRHAAVHGAIFSRMRLDLGGGADHKRTTEQLFKRSRVGRLSPALLEKEFDAARYNILSATGEMPPNLQGIWTGTWGPAWSGDFTMNGNVQSAIAAILPGNMPELMDAYFRYVESQRPDYRVNARRLYGCRGLFLPSRASSHGLQNHFCATWPMTFWTTGAAWASFFFYDYYLHSGNREFLRKRALPFMKESAVFFEDFLVPGPDGRYVVSPSYSPENNPANSTSQACINATMDIALIKELLRNLIAACETLKTEATGVKRWKALLAKMPEYLVNKDGAVREWTTPLLDDNYAHRHCSHLYPLYSMMPPEMAGRPELQRAFHGAADKRMAVRRREKGGVMAFGLVQLGLAYATLCDGEAAGEVVDWLANNFWRPSMVSTHDPQSIFNLDLSGGLPAIVIKMLVDSKPGAVHLLPAVPKAWKSGTIEGALLRGQVVLERLRWGNGSAEATLKSAIAQTVQVRAGQGKAMAMTLEAGKAACVRLNTERLAGTRVRNACLVGALAVLALLGSGIAWAESMTAERHQKALEPLLATMNRTIEAGPYKPTVESLNTYTVPDWYADAKLGIFIHFGVYSVPGFAGLGCWYGNGMYVSNSPTWKFHRDTYGPQSTCGYKDLVPLLTANKWNPDEWVSLFKEAGAKFVVPVSCFHDGYAMWDSKLTDWNVVKTGPTRDYDGLLAAATRKQGLKFGIAWHRFFQPGFFGPGRNKPGSDIHPPHAGTPWSVYGPDTVTKEFVDDSLGRFVELIDGYRPDLIWLDFDTGFVPKEDLRRFAAFYFNRATQWKKGVAINDKHEDVFPRESIVLDFERGKTSDLKPYLWQTDTSVSWRDWSYIRDDSFKSVDLLIRELVDIVSKNGVLLLDVGPKPDGTIPEEPQRILRTIGAWLKINGEAIYGTRPCGALGFGEGPSNSGGGGFSDQVTDYTAQDYRFTQKDNVIYAIAMNWPENEDHFLVKSIDNRTTLASGGISSVKLLGAKEPLDWNLGSEGLWIRKPASKPCATAFAFQIATSGIAVEQLDASRPDDQHITVAVRIRNFDRKPVRQEIAFFNNGKEIGTASFSLGESARVSQALAFESPRQSQNESISAKLAGAAPFRCQCALFSPPVAIPSWKCDGGSILAGSGLGSFEKLTLSLWTKTDELRENWTALLNSDGWKEGGMHVQYLPGGQLQISLNCGAEDIVDAHSVALPGSAKGWSLVTVTYDSAARKCEVFVNGKLDSAVTTPRAFPVNLDAFSLAGWAAEGRRFLGRIADVRIYRRVLAPEEIGMLPECKPIGQDLVAAWDFRHQEGDAVKDASGHGHDLKKADFPAVK